MAEKQTDNTPATTDAKPEGSAAARPSKATRKAKRGGGRASVWLSLIVLVLLGVVAGGGWFGYRAYQQFQTLQTQWQQRPEPADTAGLERQLRQLEKTQNQQAQALNQLRQNRVDGDLLADTAEQVASLQSRLQAMSDTNRDDWKLAEAAFLLRLASQRLLVSHNSTEAVALARAADQILKDQDDPALFAVRQALAREITALNMAESVDREGLYARLQALIEQIPSLALVAPYGRDFTSDTATGGAESQADGLWARLKARLADAWQGLGDLVRVQRRGEPAEPLLPPEQAYYLRQNLRLMLEQAQSALLDEQPQIYRQALGNARRWVGQYYALNPRAKALLEELSALAEASVSVELPQMGEAHRRLDDYLERRHQVEPAAEGES